MNPNDPLRQAPKAQQELFQLMTKAAHGFPIEHVIGAAGNLIVNALRQTNPTQRGALERCDEFSARFRAILAEHYDATGKRRNVFPFTQMIEVPLLHARKNGHG